VGGMPTVPFDAWGKTVGQTKANSKSCPNSWQSSRPQILIARIRAAIGGHPEIRNIERDGVKAKPAAPGVGSHRLGLGLGMELGMGSGCWFGPSQNFDPPSGQR